MILEEPIPPLYFNKVGDVFEGVDGQQRSKTIQKFINDEFVLDGLDMFTVVNYDGETEEIDINGLKYSELPECFQNAIKEYCFTIYYKDNADQAEIAELFYNLNNGQGMNAATMNRIKAKSQEQIFILGKHKLFEDALSQKAIDGHVGEDLAAKAHAIIYREDVCTDAKWIRPYMKEANITDEDVETLNSIFDTIYRVHSLIEDKKVAKRLYARVHMISVVPIIKRSLEEGKSDEEIMNWFVQFYSGKKSATISKRYNDYAGSGTGKNQAVKIRLEEIEKNYSEYFCKEDEKEEYKNVS